MPRHIKVAAAQMGPNNDGTPREVIVERNEVITGEIADALMEAKFERVHVRSALTCAARRGICALCYGISPASLRLEDSTVKWEKGGVEHSATLH